MSKIDWQKTLKINEDQLDDLRNTGYAYIRQGKYDIALPIYEALCVLDPKSVYDAQTLGALYLQLNEPAKALPSLERALSLEPNHPSTLLNLAKAFLNLEKKEEGLKILNILKESKDTNVSNIAKALLLAFS
jgi:tetratricopeptide (TPR) repeat protein